MLFFCFCVVLRCVVFVVLCCLFNCEYLVSPVEVLDTQTLVVQRVPLLLCMSDTCDTDYQTGFDRSKDDHWLPLEQGLVPWDHSVWGKRNEGNCYITKT